MVIAIKVTGEDLCVIQNVTKVPCPFLSGVVPANQAMVQDGIEQIRGVIVPIGFMVVRGILHFKSEPVGSKDLWDSF